MIIDVHAHYIPASLADNEKFSDLFYVKEDTFGKTMFIKNRELRPFNPGLIYLDEQIADMDKAGIDMRFISLPPFALNYEDCRCKDWTRESNKALSEDASLHRNRFRYLATLPMADMEGTIREIDRVINDPLCAGIEIATNIAGMELDDTYLEPFWKKAAEYEIFVLLHPHYTIKSARLERYHLRNLMGNPLDTTIAAFALMTGDVASKYPGVKICFSHSGGYTPYAIARFEHARKVRKEFEGVQKATRNAAGAFTMINDSARCRDTAICGIKGDFLISLWERTTRSIWVTRNLFTQYHHRRYREKISDILGGNIERLIGDGI